MREFSLKFIFAGTAFAILAALTGCEQRDASGDATEVPLGRLSDAVTPHHYRLDLKIDPTEQYFSGTVEIDVTLSGPSSHIWLHGNALEVTEAYLTTAAGARINATYEQVHHTGVAGLSLASEAPAGDAVLHLEYSAPFDLTMNGMFRIDRDGHNYALTQFQSIAARQAFPGFDQPEFKVPFDISVTARTGDVAITNAPEISAEDLGEGWTRHVYQTTPPLPTYLLAFAVGPYDLVEWQDLPPNDVRDRPLPLRGLAAAGKGDGMAYALENTASIVTALENYFGIAYPYPKLDIIAAPDFFGGAMENAGAIVYYESLLLLDEDSPMAARRRYTYVHAHELAHMWFGDLVTPVWWDDIWLNESFASWMGNKAANTHWPGGGFARATLRSALGAMAGDSLASARQIREPIELSEKINDAFDGITYRKGGGVLAMFENYLGEEAFQRGVRTHMARFPHGVATVDDFMKSLADGSGQPGVVPAFRSFIDRPGVPLVTLRLESSPDDGYILRISQNRYRPLGSPITGDTEWLIPICIAYKADGEDRKSCNLIEGAEDTIALDAKSRPSNIMPNAGGAGYYRFALDAAGWADLAEMAPEMDAREALAYADSLEAAFRAGEASAVDLVDGMTQLALNSAWDVAGVPANVLQSVTSQLLDNDKLVAAQPVLAAMFRSRYEALADATDGQSILLRTQLARFLALVAMEPGIRTEMAAQAARRIGLTGAADPMAVTADLTETVLSVGVQEHGLPFFDALMAQVKISQDPTFRNQGLGALARAEDPVLTEKLRAEVLAGAFTRPEARNIIGRQVGRAATRDATWEWVMANYEDVVKVIPGGIFGSRFIPGLGSYFCTTEQSTAFAAFIEAHAESMPGYERSLAQSMERISLCAALKEATGAELAAVFSAR